MQEHEVGMPFLMNTTLKLREYQKEGVNWLVSMCSRKLNGILADEMGLGKTVQTISMLAHQACERGIWGPHLIIVPTSVLLNWEMEFKKFCPAMKVMTYYGSAKQRKLKRKGWTSPHAFHVCITSYQLAVVDAAVFRRKQWYYMILDEAQNIKNFKSQRWNTLLHFNTQRRLLLTGTPLQNSMMELWSLLHFLMPNVFDSMTEFKYWFSNPLTSMVEGNSVNRDIVARLHGVIRPFILRRLKKDVAKQLPSKIEHVVRTHLSRRQRFLYEDFMSRSTTRHKLSKGGYMGQMSVLMSLRKVCNHPDLFEERPIISPFAMSGIHCAYPSLVQYATVNVTTNASEFVDRDPFRTTSWWSGVNIASMSSSCETLASERAVELLTPHDVIQREGAGLFALNALGETSTFFTESETKYNVASNSIVQQALKKAVMETRSRIRVDCQKRSTNMSETNRLRGVLSMKSTWCPSIGKDVRRAVAIGSIVENALKWSKSPSMFFRYDQNTENQNEVNDDVNDDVNEDEENNNSIQSYFRKRSGHRYFDYTNALVAIVVTHAGRLDEWSERLRRFIIAIPPASAPRPTAHIGRLRPWIVAERTRVRSQLSNGYHNDELVSIQSERERASRNGSTVVDISVPPPSFKPVSL